MPNAKVLSEKQAIVAELTEKIQKATAGVIVDYKGITVEEDTALRKECREGGVDYAVVKNTLLRFAFNNTGLNDLDDLLNGTTSLALADDPVAPARVMADYAKKLDGKFEIKGGFMDGKPVDLATPWRPSPRCPSCRRRSWALCWLLSQDLPWSSSRSPRRMARLPKRLPPRRQLRLPPPSKRPHTIDLKFTNRRQIQCLRKLPL